MDSNTGCRSPGDELMTRSTSDIAVCCASASCNSRVSRATFVSFTAVGELRLRVAFGALRRFSVAVWRRLALIGYPPALVRLIASPVGSGRGILADQTSTLKGVEAALCITAK